MIDSLSMTKDIDPSFKLLTSDIYIDESNVLGRGAVGQVFKGFDNNSQSIIAVKKIKIKPEIMYSLKIEMKMMEYLQDKHHPNLVGYLGNHIHQTNAYFFMEYCSHGTLDCLIKRGISEFKVITFFKDLLCGMCYLNKINVMHRDLKPSNILIDEYERLKIGDFGFSVKVDESKNSNVGTIPYQAPEVFYRKSYNPKCDVWSAGLTLYEMLSQNSFWIYKIKNTVEISKNLRQFEVSDQEIELPPSVDPIWKRFLTQMIVYNPEDRATFKQLQDEFLSIEKDLRERLLKKYHSYDDMIEHLSINPEDLSKTNSPYKAIIPTGSKLNLQELMYKKMIEQRSYTLLNAVIRQIGFQKNKNFFFLSLARSFVDNQFQCIRKVTKFILIFLSIMIFIERSKKLRELAGEKKILPSFHSVKFEEMTEEHKKDYDELMKKEEKKFERYIKSIKKQILDSHVVTYLEQCQKDSEKKEILDQFGEMKKLIALRGQSNEYSEQYYFGLYKKVANSKRAYLKNSLLKQVNKLGSGYLLTYLKIRLIADYPRFFSQLVHEQDSILVRCEYLQNLNEEQLIKQTSRYNEV